MERNEIDELRDRVPCGAVLEQAGFRIDEKQSTRRAVKHRRGNDIIIVVHEGKGWFDPLSEAKGDVFSLIQHTSKVSFGEALTIAADLVGFTPRQPAWRRPASGVGQVACVRTRWRGRRKPWRGSATWRYLGGDRLLPETVLRAAIAADHLREGPWGSMWAAHLDDSGAVAGWEERGPGWRGFSTGGTKTLFQLGSTDALRLCVTEAAIDAMSLAALEGMREGSLYLSTGGGWSPLTEEAVRALTKRTDVLLVAATDHNRQGEVFAGRLREIAETSGCDWLRLRPPAEDWNEAWKAKVQQGPGGRERKLHLPHARRPRQG